MRNLKAISRYTMSGICSIHRGHDPTCSLCTAIDFMKTPIVLGEENLLSRARAVYERNTEAERTRKTDQMLKALSDVLDIEPPVRIEIENRYHSALESRVHAVAYIDEHVFVLGGSRSSLKLRYQHGIKYRYTADFSDLTGFYHAVLTQRRYQRGPKFFEKIIMLFGGSQL